METVETREKRQAYADNSLHTLAVLENIYSRMSGTEAKSVMRRLGVKQNSEIIEKQETAQPKSLHQKQEAYITMICLTEILLINDRQCVHFFRYSNGKLKHGHLMNKIQGRFSNLCIILLIRKNFPRAGCE